MTHQDYKKLNKFLVFANKGTNIFKIEKNEY